MNLELSCNNASISPSGYKSMSVSIDNADIGEILDQIKIEDIVNHFNVRDFLEHIDIGDVIGHYGEEELFNNMDISADFKEI